MEVGTRDSRICDVVSPSEGSWWCAGLRAGVQLQEVNFSRSDLFILVGCCAGISPVHEPACAAEPGRSFSFSTVLWLGPDTLTRGRPSTSVMRGITCTLPVVSGTIPASLPARLVRCQARATGLNFSVSLSSVRGFVGLSKQASV